MFTRPFGVNSLTRNRTKSQGTLNRTEQDVLIVGFANAVEHPQLVEEREPPPRATGRAEVEAAQLLGGEDTVLVAGERDQPVALGQA